MYVIVKSQEKMKEKIYTYKGIDETGTIQQGEAIAHNQQDLVKQLRQQGIQVVTVRFNWYRTIKKALLKRHSGGISKVLFFRQLAVMLGAGLPLQEVLAVIMGASGDGKTVGFLLQNIKEGISLSASLQKVPDVFSSREVAMVAAGEQSGNLEYAFRHLSVQLEKEERLQKQMKAIMLYPFILFTGCILLIVFLLNVMLPIISSVSLGRGTQLPWITKLLIQLVEYMRINWWHILGGGGLWMFLLCLIVRIEKVRYILHRGILELPLIGGIKKYKEWGCMLYSFAMLLEGGVVFDRALSMTEQVTENLFLKNCINQMRKKLIRGGSISEGFSEAKSVPELVRAIVVAGDASGELVAVMDYSGEFCLKEAERRIKIAEALIEPAIMIFMGLMVGSVVLSIVLPMLDAMTIYV